jgi:hypothetical protein
VAPLSGRRSSTFWCSASSPLIYSLGVSLYDYTLGGDATFVGLQNYRDLLTDSVFWRKTWTTLQITILRRRYRAGARARLRAGAEPRLPGSAPSA